MNHINSPSTFFLHLTLISLVSASAPPLQLLSLVSIKSALTDPLNSFQNWDPTTAFSKPRAWCSWPGVKCDRRSNQVTGLDLSGRNLSGRIPPDIKYLSHLHYLNLSWNSFDGPLPSAIFDLPNLQSLDINHNLFNSTFPYGISNLKSLTYFNAFSNNFVGPLPEDLTHLKHLQYLNLGGSYFEGQIPSSYGSFSKLRSLFLQGNSLSGPIPSQLGLLSYLQHIELGYNAYTGGLPPLFSNLSNLVYLDASSANLSGELPAELWRLEKVENLLLFKNNFTGSIPKKWAQMGSLKILDLSDNSLSGEIPDGFSNLTGLSLMNNKLSGEIPEAIGDLPNLETLSLWNNSLSGKLPYRLGSNAKLQWLDVSSNNLTGYIPPNLCLSNNLAKLILFSNQFVGEIPSSLANCTALYRVRIRSNLLNGSIPFGFGSLPNLTFFDLSNNNLTGPIPRDLGNAVRLQLLDVSGNSLNSELPDTIWNAPNLQEFRASSSGLIGKIPDFIGCGNYYKIELDGNNLNGSIPWDIGHCEKLILLNLSRNSLSGIIPWEISALPSITQVDLSNNLLTGAIPSNFKNCTTLETFNVSYNQLTGPVPPFGFVFSSSFIGNEGLCGEIIKKPCRSDDRGVQEEAGGPKKTAGAVVWIMAAAFGVGLFILIVGTRCFQAAYGRRFSDVESGGEVGPWKLTAFQRLNFTAEEVVECLNLSDKLVLGMGSTGTVYKAEMPGGEMIAVKKLWGKNKETLIRKRRGVLAEVEVLGNVRHRNIVRLLGCCSNKVCTMLLYEYMPNGSLDDLLHGKDKGEKVGDNWVTRYNIALGVAHGISYLHHDCDPVILHRDLKPSNILLDAQMEARVADFGVAKLILTDDHSMSMSVIAGSYGYIAPEYAYTLQVDEKSDIYSYGVVLLEILTGRRSVDSEFGEGNSIVDWVKGKIKTKNGLMEVFDKNAGSSCASVREEMVLLLRVALLCTSRNPGDRPSMRDVLSMLHEAKPKRKSQDLQEPQKPVTTI